MAEVVEWIRSLGELDEYFSEALIRLREQGVVQRSGKLSAGAVE